MEITTNIDYYYKYLKYKKNGEGENEDDDGSYYSERIYHVCKDQKKNGVKIFKN